MNPCLHGETELVGSTYRRCSLPWGRTGHDAPPYKWSPGSPELRCSCCKSSACLHSGPLWNPTGLNDWWCLDILQGNKQISVIKVVFFVFWITTVKPWCHMSSQRSVASVVVNLMMDNPNLARCHVKKYNLRHRILMTERFWVMSQTELALFARVKPETVPLLCWVVRATTATSIARPIVSFQRRALVCHRFHQQLCFPGDAGSLDSRFNNTSHNPQPPLDNL